MMVGGGHGQGPGSGNNPPEPGGGGGLGPGAIDVQGVARDFSVTLSTDRSTLNLALTPNDSSLFSPGVTYSIFWLSPAIFSQNDVYGQTQAGITGNGISIIQGRQKVTDVQGGAGIVTASVPYVPYISGGWMYAVAMLPGNTREYRLQGTNFVPVPSLDPSGGPLSGEKPINPNVVWSALTGVNRLVQFGWTNAASLTSVAYVQIVTNNYMNDGFYREWATFKVNTQPGARQGIPVGQLFSSVTDTSQSIIVEKDDFVGHNITWYFVPLTAAFVPLDILSCSNIVTFQIA